MAIRLETDPLDAFGQQIAEKELGESPERMADALVQLQKLLKEDPTLYFDEEFLKIVLRPTKYYPESAYNLLKGIADFRKKHAILLANCLPSADKSGFLNTKVLNVLKDRDQLGRRILIFNVGSVWDPDQLNTDKLFRILYLIHFGAIMEPKTQVCGGIIIMDFKGLGLKQAKSLTPSFSYKLLTFIQDAMPLRLKQIHIVFQPFIFKAVWSVFKPLIRQKLKTRIIFHGSDLNSLHKYVHADCLPSDYGGTKGVIDYGSADWYPILETVEDKIKDWNTFGYVKCSDKE